MGGGASTTQDSALSVAELVVLVTPKYFVTDEVKDDDIHLCRTSWRKLIDGSAAEFRLKKNTAEFANISCLTWFYRTFYQRLFDVNPSARHFFVEDAESQGRLLMGIISTILNQLKDHAKFQGILTSLAHVHSERGIRAMQYGLFGNVLFWTLSYCLGADYDDFTSLAWIRVYSNMLKVILPVAIEDDMKVVNDDRKLQRHASSCVVEDFSTPMLKPNRCSVATDIEELL